MCHYHCLGFFLGSFNYYNCAGGILILFHIKFWHKKCPHYTPYHPRYQTRCMGGKMHNEGIGCPCCVQVHWGTPLSCYGQPGCFPVLFIHNGICAMKSMVVNQLGAPLSAAMANQGGYQVIIIHDSWYWCWLNMMKSRKFWQLKRYSKLGIELAYSNLS